MSLPSTLYPVLDLDVCARSGLRPEELVGLYQKKGLLLYQLRAKSLNWKDYLACATSLKEGSPSLSLIANDHVQALNYPGIFSGLHLGQGDLASLSVPECRLLRQNENNQLLGVSTHKLEDVQRALHSAVPWSYVAVGPCFATSSKEDASAVLTEQVFRQMFTCLEDANGIDTLVFIGGLDAQKIAELRERIRRFAPDTRLQLCFAGIAGFASEPSLDRILDILAGF